MGDYDSFVRVEHVAHFSNKAFRLILDLRLVHLVEV